MKTAIRTYNLVLNKKSASRLSPLWTQTLGRTSITTVVDNLQKFKVNKTVIKTDRTLMDTTVYHVQSRNISISRKNNASHVQVGKSSVKRKKSASMRRYWSQKSCQIFWVEQTTIMEPSHQTSQTWKDNKWQNVRKKNLFQMERNVSAVKSQDISTSNQDCAKCVKMATLSQ